MVINPIYLSLNNNSSINGENDWDPTDVKENKEMLDLTGYTLMSKITMFSGDKSSVYSHDSNIKASNNTSLIMIYCHNGGTNYPTLTPYIVGGTVNSSTGVFNISSNTKITLPTVTSGSDSIIKIKLPSSYNNLVIGFGVTTTSNSSINIPLNVWYKNE